MFKRSIRKIALMVVFFIIINNLCTFSIKANAKTTFNYGEALQKSIYFYELQRSGKLPDNKRENWRGDSGINDGSDVGLDLTGGWYDAGDFVKFNLPMTYSSTMLAWSIYEDKDVYEKTEQLSYIKDEIKWVNDYLIKCHPEKDVYYSQIGSPGVDHAWWGPAEVMQMERPSYKVTKDKPGSSVTAEGAASLASCALIFKDTDKEYSDLCIKHAKELYELAIEMNGNSGDTASNGCYPVGQCFYDELSWAGIWLYLATDEKDYLEEAESYSNRWNKQGQSDIFSYTWTQCWDDVQYGSQLLLAKLTNKDIYKESVERNLDYWTTDYNGSHIQHTPDGLAWLDQWGSLRYATTAAFLAGVYAEWDGCPENKVETYMSFMKSQVDYALGSTGQGYVVGYGDNAPKNPHHRGSQASWCDNKKEPGYQRHTLYGALVGGPNLDGSYGDDVEDYRLNEVACDYNAGYTGAVAKLYKYYGGEPIADFNGIETPTNDEFFVEAAINAQGTNFIEIKAKLYNQSGWPAKVCDKLSFKYFIDISEIVAKGLTANDIVMSTNYNQGATVSKLIPWDEDNNIYYVNVDFSGTKIYPGGQDKYKKEVQFRIAANNNKNNSIVFDSTNDFSFEGIGKVQGGNTVKTDKIPVYDDGKLVFGIEPGGKEIVGDINNDGKITLIDLAILQRYLVGTTSEEPRNSDINEDGQVDIKDMFELRKKLIA